jgi:hypothetical protein
MTPISTDTIFKKHQIFIISKNQFPAETPPNLNPRNEVAVSYPQLFIEYPSTITALPHIPISEHQMPFAPLPSPSDQDQVFISHPKAPSAKHEIFISDHRAFISHY